MEVSSELSALREVNYEDVNFHENSLKGYIEVFKLLDWRFNLLHTAEESTMRGF